MPKPTTIPVNRRALLARVDRTLAKKGLQLHVARRNGSSNFLVVDFARDRLVDNDDSLESLARKIGALRTWEQLATD
jgi:hypothetical protein